MRLNLIRMEIDRIKQNIGRVREGGLDPLRRVQFVHPLAAQGPACAICFDKFTPRSKVFLASCGHVFCAQCYMRSRGTCAICRTTFDEVARWRLHLIHEHGQPLCFHCHQPFIESMATVAIRCGHCYHTVCFDAMARNCTRCGLELGGSNMSRNVFMSFH